MTVLHNKFDFIAGDVNAASYNFYMQQEYQNSILNFFQQSILIGTSWLFYHREKNRP